MYYILNLKCVFMKKNYKTAFLPSLKKNLGKIALGALMFASIGTKLTAQVATTYQFTSTTSTYTPITGGTVLGIATNDDTSFPDLPIGFTFNYNCNSFTTFGVQSNGWIRLGAGTVTSSYTPISVATASTVNVISAIGRDLQGNTTTGELSYLTTGIAPNRVLTVQWKSYRKFVATGDDYNFQIKLYETTNSVEIIYGTITNNATSLVAEVGIKGSSNADFNNRTTTSDWSATTAGATNAATCTASTAIFPAAGTTYRWVGPPPNPSTPIQDVAIPTCATGSILNLAGTAGANVTWYWQTSAAGTSTATPQSGATYTVFANGTYFLRAYNSVTALWSCTSSSVVVSNFPVATAPAAPTADVNPSCVTTGSVLTAATPPAQIGYFWQGTNATGSSSALPAATTYLAPTTGTYYLAAYDSVSSCWSNTSSLLVTVSTAIPLNPVANPSTFNLCTGVANAPITAVNPDIAAVQATTQAGGNGCSGGNMLDITTNASPVTITSVDVTPEVTSTQNVKVYYKLATYVGSETTSGAWTLVGTYSINGTTGVLQNVDIADFTIPAATTYGIYVSYDAQYTSTATTYTNSYFTITTGAGLCSEFGGVNTGRTFNGAFHYSIPSSATLSWYDAATAGNLLGSGSPFETIGTSVLPDGNTGGTYSFYAQAQQGPCPSATRALVTVALAPVNVTLTPASVTCNNGNDGTFTITNVLCGTAPFSFSVDGGSFGPAPTNLTVGNHTVVVMDGGMQVSNAYTITIGNALAPTGIIVNTFNNSEVDLSWIANGSEAAWNVEWGVPGFTPGTGTQLGMATAVDTNYLVTGLSGDTDYEFYVSANCGLGTTAGSWISTLQTTSCDPLVAQGWCESFDSDSQTEACWTVLNVNNDADFWNTNYTTNPFSGDQCAMLYTDFNAGNNNDWLILPRMTLTANEIMNFKYRVQSAGEPNDFEVLLSYGGPTPAEFLDTIMVNNSYSNIVYQDTAVNLSAYSGDVYIAFHVRQGGLDGWRLYIDQVCIDICTPAAGTDGSVNVCRLDSTLNLNSVITQGESNGVWSFSPNPSAINGSDLTVTAIPDGAFSAQYVVTTACTSDTTNANFTIFPASRAGTDGVLNVCRNQQLNLLSGLSGIIDLGGTWYNPSNTALASGQINSGNLPGQFNYYYIAGNGVCPNDTSNIVLNVSATCNALGLEEFVFSGITIYPNPNNGVFTIANSTSDQNYSYEVADLNGRIIKAAKDVNGLTTAEVDLSKVENGIYMVRIFNANGEKMERIVKQ